MNRNLLIGKQKLKDGNYIRWTKVIFERSQNMTTFDKMRKEIDDLKDSYDKLSEDVKTLTKEIDELEKYINEKYKIE